MVKSNNENNFVTNKTFNTFKKETNDKIGTLSDKIDYANETQLDIKKSINDVTDKLNHVTDIFELGFENMKERLEISDKSNTEKFNMMKELQDQKLSKMEDNVDRFIGESRQVMDDSLRKYVDDIQSLNTKVNEHDARLVSNAKDRTAFWGAVISGIVAVVVAALNILPALLG